MREEDFLPESVVSRASVAMERKPCTFVCTRRDTAAEGLKVLKDKDGSSYLPSFFFAASSVLKGFILIFTG